MTSPTMQQANIAQAFMNFCPQLATSSPQAPPRMEINSPYPKKIEVFCL
jgi:hypothetical protein